MQPSFLTFARQTWPTTFCSTRIAHRLVSGWFISPLRRDVITKQLPRNPSPTILFDANQSASPKEVEMKLLTIAATAALALTLLSSAGLPAEAKQEVLMTTLPANGIPVSEFYKQSVYDTHDNKIGDINDVLLDKSGQVSAVILGVGGLLGIGEKDVAVPFNAIQVTEKSGNRYLVMDASKAALQAATGYTYDRTKRAWVPSTTKKPG
jgi:sporulation protein YlmC with PRC-barrel domain